MTEKNIWHAIEAGLTAPWLRGQKHGGTGAVLAVGDEIEIDSDFLAVTKNAYGDSWADDLSDEAQLERWRKVFLKEGPVTEVLLLELAAAAATEAEKLRLERVREAHRWGTKVAE